MRVHLAHTRTNSYVRRIIAMATLSTRPAQGWGARLNAYSGTLHGGVAAGETWNFQLWYRDPNGGGANFSDGLSSTFEP
jgi:hypothetical protein